MEKLNESYKKSTFTHKFIDPQIEAEYARKHHEDVKEFTLLYLVEIVTSFIIFFIFQVYNLSTR